MRKIAWFSCGASSAVAAKLAVRDYDAEVIYCDTMSSEHPDNQRFFNDCQEWFGKKIRVIRSTQFKDVNDVIQKKKYMSGVMGAPCTSELKKLPRELFQLPTDTHIFGYTREEQKRADDFESRNPSLNVEWILIDYGIDNLTCKIILDGAGIKLPAMYSMGYEHNNCLGCVKSSSGQYWNKIRVDFPEVFKTRVLQSKLTGAKLVSNNGHRYSLELLDPEWKEPQDNIDCGPVCVSPLAP